jgi:hypothetical protein
VARNDRNDGEILKLRGAIFKKKPLFAQHKKVQSMTTPAASTCPLGHLSYLRETESIFETTEEIIN